MVNDNFTELKIKLDFSLTYLSCYVEDLLMEFKLI